MSAQDRFGNELREGDKVVVFFALGDEKLRPGIIKFIAEGKRSALVLYEDELVSRAIDRTLLVKASDPNVSVMLLQQDST